MAENIDYKNGQYISFCQGDFEESLVTGCSDADENFDAIIGHIEDIIMEDSFQELQNDFMQRYYLDIDESDENKLFYTDIHKEYIELIENFLAQAISERVPNFSMEEFTKSLMSRKDELEGEIFDLLMTFSDFVAFKELVLDYRADKEGRSIDFGSDFTVTSMSKSSPLNKDIHLSLFDQSIGNSN